MTDHLPECCMNMYDAPPDGHCICPALRACEQRVRDEHGLERLRAYEKGCKVGVQAARDAVASVPWFDRFALGRRFRNEALAAIDALRTDERDK